MEDTKVFVDTKGRSIRIEASFDDVYAYHDDEMIGEFLFDDLDGDPRMFNMNLEGAYQRSGIGTEMMKTAAAIHGKNILRPSYSAQGGSNKQSYEYFTMEGAAFVQSCVRNDVLNEQTDPDENVFDDDWMDDAN